MDFWQTPSVAQVSGGGLAGGDPMGPVWLAEAPDHEAAAAWMKKRIRVIYGVQEAHYGGFSPT